jgi:DNA-binding NtrC family response regulator
MSSQQTDESRALNRLVVVSHAMSETVKTALRLVNACDPVWVDGEPGTGKKMLARVLHEESAHADRPLVIVRCDTLTVAALDRTLFGDAAAGCKGKLEEASEGTLVLLNAEELNPVAQERLLTVMEQDYYTTAAGESRPLNCRIVCTGDAAAVEEQVKLGRFSQELFGRLTAKMLRMPSLSERRDDIPHLVIDVLHAFARREHVEAPMVPYHYMELLMNVAWPENVRQLRNHVESVMALSEGIFDPEIIREHFTPVTSASTIKGAFESLLGRIRGGAAQPAISLSKR